MLDHALIPTRHGDGPPPAVTTPIQHLAPDGPRIDGLGAGDSSYCSAFLDPDEADRTLRALLPEGGEIAYQQWFHMPDPRHPDRPLRPLRRAKIAMATAPAEGRTPLYRFPVNRQHRHGIVSPMTPTVEALRQRVSALTGRTFNHAVVMVYRDGNDSIGLHKDKLLDLDPEAPIACLSLGQPRPLLLRDHLHHPTIQQQLLLASGSLYLIGPRTNAALYHAIPPLSEGDGPCAPRVSVTFRRTCSFFDADGHVYGQGAAYPTLDWPEALRGAHRDDPT